VQLKENGFWLCYLTNQYQNDENPEQILSYQEALKKIAPEALKTAANKYLGGDNYIRLVLYPGKTEVNTAK
jgi:zinc protease